MAERQVSIGGVTYPLPDPFLVLATQNPIESEGVYPLPEAQRDRFLMKFLVDYPTPGGGARDRLPDGRPSRRSPRPVLGPDELRRLQQAAARLRAPRARRLRRPAGAGHPRPADTAWPTSPRGCPTGVPAGHPRPGRRRPRAGADARPRLRAAAGRPRRRRRRAAPPPGALLRRARRRRAADHIVQAVCRPWGCRRSRRGIAPAGSGRARPGGPLSPRVFALRSSGPPAAPTAVGSAAHPGSQRSAQGRTPRDPASPPGRGAAVRAGAAGSRAPGPAAAPGHPRARASTPGAGDGAPPRFTDGPTDVLLRRLELTVRRGSTAFSGRPPGCPGLGSEAGDSGPTTRVTTFGAWTGR